MRLIYGKSGGVMSATLTQRGLPADITPYRLKHLLQQARTALGVSTGAVRYLAFAIENCQPADFQNGRICAIWHSLERLANIFGMSRRQIGRIEAELVDAGLIRRTYNVFIERLWWSIKYEEVYLRGIRQRVRGPRRYWPVSDLSQYSSPAFIA